MSRFALQPRCSRTRRVCASPVAVVVAVGASYEVQIRVHQKACGHMLYRPQPKVFENLHITSRPPQELAPVELAQVLRLNRDKP